MSPVSSSLFTGERQSRCQATPPLRPTGIITVNTHLAVATDWGAVLGGGGFTAATPSPTVHPRSDTGDTHHFTVHKHGSRPLGQAVTLSHTHFDLHVCVCVSTCVSLQVCVCLWVCLSVCMSVYVCLSACVYKCVCVCMHVCRCQCELVCVCKCMCVSVCVYVCVYKCLCVCMCVYKCLSVCNYVCLCL